MLFIHRHVSAALWGTALSALTIASAYAQTAPATVQDAERDFDIPAGPLAKALNTWSLQSGRSIVFRTEDMGSRRTRGVKGRMSGLTALNRLLVGSGFVRILDADGAVALSTMASVDTDSPGNATPDILVTGSRSWSLNTGIKRSQDDSQPFIVLTGEEIRRSGAPSLESYLRDHLNVSASPTISEQATSDSNLLPASRGLSNINLRGLGSRDTLILVDGRRQPGVNIGDGTLTQSSITGIPIASIERIEVLASSASGIYGSGASGGVINIVLKRDFHGGEIAINYADTTDFAAGAGQIDLTYGMPLEGGRTKLSVTGSWRKSDPLLFGDRNFLAVRSREALLANDPAALEGAYLPPYGRAVNYRNAGFGPLVLKPQYGGGTLASGIGSIPAGYNGLTADGVAGLLAGIGSFNLQQPDSAVGQGARAPLIFGSSALNGSLTLRREFNPWLTGYVGATASRTRSTTDYARNPTILTVGRNAPGNPFTSPLLVALPGVSQEYRVFNTLKSLSMIGGAIVKLPYEWQAALDLSYSTTDFNSDIRPPDLTARTLRQLTDGTQNVLRDLSLRPLDLAYDAVPFGSARQPGRASNFSPSLRIAGPVPLRLPGGKPRITVNVEFSDNRIAGSTGTFLNTTRVSTYTPLSTQQTWSGYGEVALPLLGPDNRIPLIRELELRISARGEWYRGSGGDPYLCPNTNEPASLADPYAGCPPEGAQFTSSVTRNSHIDPSISLRWVPVEGVMLRGSYTTGYLPPQLSQLVKKPQERSTLYGLGDPARGGEAIGVEVDGFPDSIRAEFGGNPDVRPETSRTFSAGTVLTPKFLDGLRFSADWTHISKRDVYFDPSSLIFAAFDPRQIPSFNAFLAASPDRVTREAPSGGFPVGRITAIDFSLINLNGVSTDAIDFTLDYTHPLLGGTLDFGARATHVISLEVDSFPAQPPQQYAGVVSTGFATAAGANGSLRWRGSGSIRWTKGPLSMAWQSRYFDRYRLTTDDSIVPAQGSRYVASQLYHDVSASYEFSFQATLTAGINNIFNTLPPLDATAGPLFYSAYSDPRLRNFYIGLRKSF